jgi:hypothetical protein
VTCWVAIVVYFVQWLLLSTALGRHIRSSVHTAIDTFSDQAIHNLTNVHIDNVVHIDGSFPLTA